MGPIPFESGFWNPRRRPRRRASRRALRRVVHLHYSITCYYILSYCIIVYDILLSLGLERLLRSGRGAMEPRGAAPGEAPGSDSISASLCGMQVRQEFGAVWRGTFVC